MAVHLRCAGCTGACDRHDHPRRRRDARARAPERARAPSPARRAERADRARGAAEPVGAEPQRVGERLLQRGRALDEHELAQLPVRVGRPERRDDGRQAAAGAVGAGVVGARVRLPPAEHARAAGADGRRERGAGVRPRAPALRPRRRLRGRARAGADADHGGDLAPQQPGRAARAVLRRGAVVHVRALEDGRTRWIVLAGVCVGLGFETKMLVALVVVPAIAVAYLLVVAARTGSRAAPAARRRRGDGARRRRMAGARRADAGGRPAVDLGHERQQHLLADLRIQRPRPRRRPGGRSGRDRRRRRRRCSAARRGHCAC